MKAEVSNDPRTESEISVLVGGVVTVAFGLLAVLAAIGLGWAAAAALGAALLVVAWKVPTSASARVLSYLVAGFGVMSLLGAMLDLFT